MSKSGFLGPAYHYGWWRAICIQTASPYTFTYHLLLNIKTQLQSLDCELPEQESQPSAGFLENCLSPYCIQPTSPRAPTTTTYIQQPPCTTTTTTQCKLQYVHAVYAQVILGRRPPAQVAEGSHHKLQRLATTSAGRVVAATTCNLHMGTYMFCSCAHMQVALLLHPAPTCVDGCWCQVPLTFSKLRSWCFSFQQLAQTLYLHLWWLPSATCAGGLFPSRTCIYTACTYCNLHCVVVIYTVQVAIYCTNINTVQVTIYTTNLNKYIIYTMQVAIYTTNVK